MEPFVRRFVRASLVWLSVGGVLGLAMALAPGHAAAYRPAHAHANLLGFVSMMIFGVAYHIFPRFAGRPLHSRRMAAAHLWTANAGLALMVAGFVLRVHAWRPGMMALGTGAVASAAGIALFVVNVWRTLDAPVAKPAPAAGRLPVADPAQPLAPR